MRKGLAILLALVMILAAVPLESAFADETVAETVEDLPETQVDDDTSIVVDEESIDTSVDLDQKGDEEAGDESTEDVTIENENKTFTVQDVIDQAEEVDLNKEIVVKDNGKILYTYLKFRLPKEGAVLVDMRDDNTGGFSNHFSLYNEDKELIERRGGLGYSNTYTHRAPVGLSAGTYYLYLELKSSVYGNSCVITINFEESDLYEKELNDSIATANNKNLNSTIIGSSRDSGGDKDYYEFNVLRSGTVFVDWSGDDNDSSYYTVTFLDSNNDRLISSKIRARSGRNVNDDTPLADAKVNVGPGKYYLKIETLSEGGYNYGVKVNYEEATPVTAISLNMSSNSVLIGDTFTLAANVIPVNATNKTVIWSSSDDDVATVTSEGVVTGVSPGTATITAKAADGEKTAACRVTVVNPKPEAPVISSVTNLEKGLKIKWNKINNVVGYQIYRSMNGGKSEKIATVKGTSYTDVAANINGAKYNYRVYSYTECKGTTYKGSASSAKTSYRLSQSKAKSVKNNAAKSLTVIWGKNAKGNGYQVQYSTDKNFKNAKTVTVTSAKTTSKKITGLKKNETYYVRIRPYKTVSKTKYYGAWSKYSKGVKVMK